MENKHLIPQPIIDELKEKADIVSIISSYLSLQKRGKNHIALCPFHSEKTPSFTVSAEKGLYHCFGCGKGGNVFTFVMEIEKADFSEAAQIIGEKVGIHVEKSAGSSSSKSSQEKLFSVVELACRFYESNIDGAHDYINKRGIQNPKTFRLGYAAAEWDALLKHLISRGVKEEDIEKAGLIHSREKGGFYDRFRNRLIFPITDHRKRVVGFSGRTPSDEEPKYINSPDSIIFNKGEHLYNLGLARDAIKQQKFVLLVEGNLDVVSSYEAGIKNVVAPLGTAFTTAQAKLLARFTDLVVLAFDSDSAGHAAGERVWGILRDDGLRVRVASCEGAKDPDELIRKHGKDALIECIQKSYSAAEFKLRKIISRFNLNDAEAKAYAAHEVAAFLSCEKDKILQREYTKLAAELIRIEETVLASEIQSQKFYRGSKSSLRRVTQKPTSKTAEAEKKLIRLIMEWSDAITMVKDELQLENFANYQNIMRKLWELNPDQALEALEEPDAKMLREIILNEEPLEDKNKILSDCINALKTEAVKNQINEIRASISSAEKSKQLNVLAQMKNEYLTLNEILRSLTR